jgi:glucose/arabinose dehydrogenase
MISAFLHKAWAYCLFAFCEFGGFGCGYGAAKASTPPQIQIHLPAGFKISVFSQLGNLGQPRMMAMDSQGRLFTALANSNMVIMLPDTNQDGVAETPVVIAKNLNSPNGLAFIDDNHLLISNQDGVVSTQLENGKWSAPTPLIRDLPTGGHTLKTIKIGPDKHIYINVGSSCNVCVESDPLRATILRYTLDGKAAGHLVTLGQHAASPIWANGLRNSQASAWHPKTAAMFATNNGADMRASTKNGAVNDEIPPEHFNQIEPSKHYGWPYCWGDADLQSATLKSPAIQNKHLKNMLQDPNFVGVDNFCQTATPPAITFTSHSTPMGIAFLNQTNWPEAYKTDAIVALHGSWNRENPSGYKLVRVKFVDNQPVEVTDFATGWLDKNSAWGRPTDVIVAQDGALYMSDDRAGMIMRIHYK